MPDPKAAQAATFVEPRGMIRSVVAGVAGMQAAGVAGSVAGHRLAERGTEEASPLRKGEIGYLAAGVDKGRIAGVLTVAFADGTTWEFDVPKVHLGGARQIAGRLGAKVQ